MAHIVAEGPRCQAEMGTERHGCPPPPAPLHPTGTQRTPPPVGPSSGCKEHVGPPPPPQPLSPSHFPPSILANPPHPKGSGGVTATPRPPLSPWCAAAPTEDSAWPDPPPDTHPQLRCGKQMLTPITPPLPIQPPGGMGHPQEIKGSEGPVQSDQSEPDWWGEEGGKGGCVLELGGGGEESSSCPQTWLSLPLPPPPPGATI